MTVCDLINYISAWVNAIALSDINKIKAFKLQIMSDDYMKKYEEEYE